MADNRCPVLIHWWDCGLTARCTLPAWHDGWHSDGLRWFDAYGRQQPTEPARGAVAIPGQPA